MGNMSDLMLLNLIDALDCCIIMRLLCVGVPNTFCELNSFFA